MKENDNSVKQTTCKRCGRKLKSIKAIELGMGAICWKKYKTRLRNDGHIRWTYGCTFNYRK